MSLHPTPSNPLPEGAVVETVTASDGITLRAAHWPARRSQALGTIAIFHGHGEFIEKYFEVVGELLERGFAVATFDWRSQGGSRRGLPHPSKSHVTNFARYRRDARAFIAQVLEPHCPKPWFGLAHSMGGAILAGALTQGPLPFERVVLTAPMLKIALRRYYASARGMARLLRNLGLGRLFVPGGGSRPRFLIDFNKNPLTSDPDRFRRLVEIVDSHPALVVGSPTIGWLHAAFRYCTWLEDPALAARIRMPMLIFACGGDTIVDNVAIDRFAGHLKTGGRILIPYARHEILMEREPFRRQFWAAFDAFIPGTRLEQLAGAPADQRTKG